MFKQSAQLQRVIAIGTSVVLVLCVTVSGQSAEAGLIDDLKQKISRGASEVQKVQQEISKFQQQIEQTAKQANTLKGQIQQLDLTDKKLKADITVTQKKITTTQLTIQTLDSDIGTKEEAIEGGRQALSRSLREQVELDDTSLVEVALAESSFSDFWDRTVALASFGAGVNEHLSRLRGIKAELEDSKARQEGEKAKLLSLKTDLSSQHEATVQNKQQKNRLLVETKNEEATYQKLLADRKKRMQQLQDEINAYEAQLKIAIDPSSLPASGSRVLAYPVDKVTITQYFGNTAFATANAQVYGGKGHNGIDLGVPTGSKVVAAASGVVVDTGDTDAACYKVSYGKWVLIRHPSGLSTLYAHLSVIGVSAGQDVRQGQQIGLSGNTGYSTGPHVHFTVYATAGVSVSNDYVSKVCGTRMKLPLSSLNAYLNPLSYL